MSPFPLKYVVDSLNAWLEVKPDNTTVNKYSVTVRIVTATTAPASPGENPLIQVASFGVSEKDFHNLRLGQVFEMQPVAAPSVPAARALDALKGAIEQAQKEGLKGGILPSVWGDPSDRRY